MVSDDIVCFHVLSASLLHHFNVVGAHFLVMWHCCVILAVLGHATVVLSGQLELWVVVTGDNGGAEVVGGCHGWWWWLRNRIVFELIVNGDVQIKHWHLATLKRSYQCPPIPVGFQSFRQNLVESSEVKFGRKAC